MHSNIERALKKFKINIPIDYIQIIESARKGKSGKYGVKYVDFSFFKNYREACDIKMIKPSNEVGHPYVIDIRQLKYCPDAKIEFNLSYDYSQWEILPRDIFLTGGIAQPLYSAPLKISFMKYTHLQEIKKTIPKEAHFFYDNLDHHPNPKCKK